jgi:hypothetical protein
MATNLPQVPPDVTSPKVTSPDVTSPDAAPKALDVMGQLAWCWVRRPLTGYPA